MRRSSRVCGISLVEFIAASSIATVISGAVLILLNGMRDVYQTHTTFNQLSGYLDTATTMLRQDVWGATSATQSGSGACPSDWLRLTNPPVNTTTVVYCLDTADSSNIKLRRTANGGTAWNVAQYIVQAGTTALPDTPQTGLVTTNVQVRRTVNGRTYLRQVNSVVYRMQAQ